MDFALGNVPEIDESLFGPGNRSIEKFTVYRSDFITRNYILIHISYLFYLSDLNPYFQKGKPAASSCFQLSKYWDIFIFKGEL